MKIKPKISPNDTYILDEEEVDELDELSFTTVIGDATGSLEQPAKAQDDSAESEESTLSFMDHDPAIDELLDDSLTSDRGHVDSGDTVELEGEALENLLDPELLFPDET